MEKQIECKDNATIRVIDRMLGIADAKAALEGCKVEMPGMKLAIAIVDVEFQKCRQVSLARAHLEAGKAGVDFSKECVTGFQPAGKKIFITVQPVSEIDHEQSA